MQLFLSFWRSRLVRHAVFVLIGLYGAYLAAANVFLGFHLLDRAVTSEDGTIELRTGRAWSLVPGRAGVRDFVLRLDSDDLQLRLTATRATTGISLWRLLRREVRLSDVQAAGLSFRLRMRVEAIGPDNGARVAAYPDIEGALGPPLFSAAKASAHTPPEKAWHVEVTDTASRADEVWIQEYRLTGNIEVGGGFALWPGKDFTLRRSTARVSAGVVRVGPREVTHDFELVAGAAEISTVSLPDTHGADVLQHLTATATGSSTLQDASFLDVYPHVPKIRVQPARSSFDARFVTGRFARGTTATLDVRNGSLEAPGVSLRGAVIARVQVPQDGDLELGADSDAGQITIDALPSTQAAAWTVHATSLRQILHVVVGEEVRAGLGAYKGELRTPTLGWFEDLAELGVKTRGHASATFDFTRDASGRTHGPWSARIDDGMLLGDELTASVTSTAHGGLSTKPNPAEGVSVIGVHVEMPRASMQAAGAAAHTTWLRADIASASVAVEPHFEAHVSADATAGDGGLVAGVVEAEAGLVLGPIAAHFLDGAGMDVRFGVAAEGRNVTLDVPHARIGTVDAKGFWMRHGEHAVLACVLQRPPLGVGVRLGDGAPLVVPTVSDIWLSAQRP